MSYDDPLGERGRSIEDDYFRKKDRELVEKLRRSAAAEEARRDLIAKSGIDDPELVKELEALGFTPETVSLLPLVPVIQVAWAEGGVTDAERTLVTRLARSRGIAEGSSADRQLSNWLDSRPSTEVFARATRLVRAMLSAPATGPVEGTAQEHAALSADDLVKYCESIAAASGGIFGIHKISAEERALLAAIASDLKRPSA